MAISGLSLSNTTRRRVPSIPVALVKERILGSSYDLSVVFVGETYARRLNRETRDKTYVPNVLSFPLSNDSGEMYICLTIAKREAPHWNLSYRNYVLFLLIHGMLHLDGMDHGDKMEQLEQKLLGEFRM